MSRWYLFSVAIMTVFWHSVLAQGKFSGYMLGDYFYNVARDPGLSSVSNAAAGGKK